MPTGGRGGFAAAAGQNPLKETTTLTKETGPNRPWSTEIPLVGAGGEPVDLKRTLLSHGFVELPPMRLEEEVPALEVTLAANGRAARTVEIRPGKRGHARVDVLARAPSARTAGELVARVRHVLALDEDLSDFYRVVADDPDLSWAATGAGRMIRSPSVFEDVVKTSCTGAPTQRQGCSGTQSRVR